MHPHTHTPYSHKHHTQTHTHNKNAHQCAGHQWKVYKVNTYQYTKTHNPLQHNSTHTPPHNSTHYSTHNINTFNITMNYTTQRPTHTSYHTRGYVLCKGYVLHTWCECCIDMLGAQCVHCLCVLCTCMVLCALVCSLCVHAHTHGHHTLFIKHHTCMYSTTT